MRPGSRGSADRGSTIPLILGFFLVALLMIGGAIAAADAFVQQRGLQDVCDGAASAAAAAGARLDRGASLGAGAQLAFDDVEQAIARYLARDSDRAGVHADAALSADATTVLLTCTETAKVAFGAMFGRGAGVRHTVHSAARSPLSG
jgi:uncharacterized membrane protein